MSKNGVLQLKKLSIYVCDKGGSSKGVRALVESGQVYELAKENPELQVEIVKRPGHPYITATYKNGRTLIHDCKNKDQDALALKVLHIRSTWGNKGRKFGNGKVGAEVRSVQGGWNPLLWQYSQAQQRDLLSLQVKE